MMVAQRDSNAAVAKSGWLYKQDGSGMGGVRIWRKRWFVLSDFCLFYYKDSDEDGVLGSIILPSYTISTLTLEDKISRKYAFKIEHLGMRTYFISAESYSVMAEWVRVISPVCALQPDASKNGSRKGVASKENSPAKPTDEDVEFGFSEPRSALKAKDRKHDQDSRASSIKNNPHVIANGNHNNAKLTGSPPVSTPTSLLPRQQNTITRSGRSSSATGRSHHSTTLLSGGSVQPRRQLSDATKNATKRNHQRAPTRQHDNGEHYSDVSNRQHKRLPHSNNKLERNNSMVKLGSWVQSQRQKQHSTNTLNSTTKRPTNIPIINTANGKSAVTSPNRNLEYFNQPGRRSITNRVSSSSGKRYKPAYYNDYMDPSEVASSIMSVPPLYRNKITSLPRPRSSQDLNEKRSQRRKMGNSKSVSYLSPDRHLPPTTRTKSEHDLPQHKQRSSLQARTPDSAHTPSRRYDSVFSPASNQYDKHFNYEPLKSPLAFSTSPSSKYGIKQINSRGQKDQSRGFTGSSITVNDNSQRKSNQNISNGLMKLSLNESDIEFIQTVFTREDSDTRRALLHIIKTKLNRLNELDEVMRQLSDELNNLRNDKRRLEQSLQKAKANFDSGGKSEFELEQKLSKVKSQLAKSTQKLKDMSIENGFFEQEIRKLKAKLLEDLNKGRKLASKSNQRQLEWELGRVEFMIEGVSRNKAEVVDKIESLKGERQDSDQTPPNSGKPNTNKTSYDSTAKSPRDVKRISMERRTSGSNTLHVKKPSSNTSPQNGKFFTLPGYGVSHATSVDSLTAASLARFTKPHMGKTNLHRTKSAAERLFAGSNGNLISTQDPTEIKKIQREINQNRRRTLTGDFTRHSDSMPRSFVHHDTHMQVGIDVQMAIKHHRMPKVLQRAKRDMYRSEFERSTPNYNCDVGFDVDRFESDVKNASSLRKRVISNDATDKRSLQKEDDVESDELYVDVNLTHQLITPDKVEIPDRLVEYQDISLSPDQEKAKLQKIRAIESMLSRSGRTASQPTVHLAAALAAEAGSVARAVAYQAQQSKPINPSIV